ncbi:MAG TPA: hypothetical protein VJQ82_27765 [Terriglobales bacterium]|nr:hypothetical protein [Terriglobales bacterium]
MSDIRSTYTRIPPGPYTYWCHLLRLPEFIRLSTSLLPFATHYMSAPREKASCWQHKLEAMACNGARNENLRVGIVWNGGETHSLDRFRSIHLDSVKPLFAVQGVTWFSVQKGINERQTESLEAVCDLHTLGPSIDDFTDTLGILEALDLLVTVDTSVAHLAGAAGVPVWVLVPAYSEWRWLKDRRIVRGIRRCGYSGNVS